MSRIGNAKYGPDVTQAEFYDFLQWANFSFFSLLWIFLVLILTSTLHLTLQKAANQN